MTDTERHRLLGRYKTPRFKYGAGSDHASRSEVAAGGVGRELKGKDAKAYQTTKAWLVERLKEAFSIKVGSTYADVCKHFRSDGGLSTPMTHRYVMILCPYIKIDVEFEPLQGDKLSPTMKVSKVLRPYFEPEFID